MRPPALNYVRAASPSDAAALLSGNAIPIAGGQGVMRDIRARTLQVGTLVDISRIPELDYIRLTDDALEIGAVTTLATVAEDPTVREHLDALATAASRVADVQIRNRGTVGGNICGSWVPSWWANDIGTVLSAAGGEVTVLGRDGTRSLPGGEFVAADSNPLEPAEIITALRFPRWDGSAYVRLSRQWADAGIGSATACVRRTGTGVTVGLAVGRVHHRSIRLDDVARTIETDGLEAPSVGAAIAAAARSFTVPSTTHADADYRRAVLPVLVRRAVSAALDNGGIR
jgi:carbon-monoxide dehydrogenase medium subunit